MKIRFAIIALLLASCSANPNKQQLETGDYKSNLNQALSEGDCRFLATLGVGTDIPGIKDNEYKFKIFKDENYRYIDKSGDVIRNEEHMQFKTQATRYAASYNHDLVKAIKNGQKCNL